MGYALPEQNHYQTLGVPADADLGDIKVINRHCRGSHSTSDNRGPTLQLLTSPCCLTMLQARVILPLMRGGDRMQLPNWVFTCMTEVREGRGVL